MIMFGKTLSTVLALCLLTLHVSATDSSLDELRQQVARESLLKRQTAASPGPPSTDPFYALPANLTAYKPGDIIDHRVTGNLSGVNYTSSWQILYRTTDSLGNATATVTTVIVPLNPDFEKLLSFQIPYDSADVDCSPSYTLVGGGFNLNGGLQSALDQGWIVSTPDYEGPLAAFTAGVISGQATLDSIRSVLRSQSFTGVCPTSKLAMWGYSGGALASEWAGELQKDYAPELKFEGAALGGLTPNVLTVARSVNNQTLAGLIPAGILGLSAAYPNLSDFVQNHLIADKKASFDSVKSFCIAQEVLTFHDTDFFSYFINGEADLEDPVSTSVINAGGIMGLHGQPQIPLLVYKSIYDEVSPVNDTDALVKQYCDNGAQIQYLRFNFGNHLEASDDGQPYALKFLEDIFNGLQQPAACNTTTIQPST